MTHDDSPALNDTHRGLLHSETASMPDEEAWLRWIAEAELLAGHSLDGDQTSGRDGYSLDGAYIAWAAGATPEGYVRSFQPAASS